VSTRDRTAARIPRWSTAIEAVGLIARGYTFRPCIRIALVVGTVLSIVNQGAVVVDGADAMTAVRIGFNYFVPFVVSSIGYLAAFRVPRRTDQA
jgi:hypothetical protein